jgi:hypothetical protein
VPVCARVGVQQVKARAKRGAVTIIAPSDGARGWSTNHNALAADRAAKAGPSVGSCWHGALLTWRSRRRARWRCGSSRGKRSGGATLRVGYRASRTTLKSAMVVVERERSVLAAPDEQVVAGAPLLAFGWVAWCNFADDAVQNALAVDIAGRARIDIGSVCHRADRLRK